VWERVIGRDGEVAVIDGSAADYPSDAAPDFPIPTKETLS
jgi:hypothetical protein